MHVIDTITCEGSQVYDMEFVDNIIDFVCTNTIRFNIKLCTCVSNIKNMSSGQQQFKLDYSYQFAKQNFSDSIYLFTVKIYFLSGRSKITN